MDKLKMQTLDIVEDNIEKIAEIFPNCITETKNEDGEITRAIDFDLLRQELSGKIVEGQEERYQINWPGKRQALLTANAPILKTLRPVPEESVDFDNTKNIFIEGDNLEALKLLQESYLGKVKMIYIDPPYNKRTDLIYYDDFSIVKDGYLRTSGQIDGDGNKLRSNPESNGRYHSDWLSMIFPRLKLARKLLREDGVIFISIDDNEAANLQRVCDEVFGSTNMVAIIPAITNLKGNPDTFGFSDTHEFILCYCKNIEKCNLYKFGIDDSALEEWEEDEHGLFKRADTLRRTGQDATRERRPRGWFPIFITSENFVYCNDEDRPLNESDFTIWPINDEGIELSWTWSKPKIKNEPHNLIVVVGRNGNPNIYKKQRAELGGLPTSKPKSVFYKPEYSTSTATTNLKSLMGVKVFDGPKPVPLIKDLELIATQGEDIIIDFFAGSATTAHATMQLNAEDGGNRQFIMVQWPEICDEKSEAYRAGYKNIAEISKERIRRAGQKIKSENPETTKNLDIGFRVLKVDTTNMKDVFYTPQQTNQAELFKLVDNIKEDRSDLDLLFQVFIDWAIPLDQKIIPQKINNCQCYLVNQAPIDLLASFADNIDDETIKQIAALNPAKAIFRDGSFKTPSSKINCGQYFKQLSPNTEVKFL